MPLSALFLVLLGALIHALWNIAAKKSGGDVRFAFFSSLIMFATMHLAGLAHRTDLGLERMDGDDAQRLCALALFHVLADGLSKK
jgi:FtsH-binding integral membrane protein